MRRHTKRASGRPERGVTLVELLVVVAILGLFMLVALPAIGNYIRAGRVRASNDGIVGDLKAARYIAITNRTTATVTFDQTARTWSYTDIHGRTITRTLELGTSFTTLTATPVTFKSDGSLSTSAATIVIEGRAANKSDGTALLHQYTISAASTGRVTSVFLRF